MNLMEQIWYMWNNCVVDSSKLSMAQDACQFIMNNRVIYQQVGDTLNVPFYVIGAIHYREASFSFKTYLANGDPLFDENGNPIETAHVPKGLGPFPSWTAAAIGSIQHMNWGVGWHWDLCNALDNCERYNGLGYRGIGKPSPYIWAGTNQYVGGLWVKDGPYGYDANVHDNRIGCAVIFKALKLQGIDLNEVAIA